MGSGGVFVSLYKGERGLFIQRPFEYLDLFLGLLQEVLGSSGVTCGEGFVRSTEIGIHQACGLQPVSSKTISTGSLPPLEDIECAVNGSRARRHRDQRLASLLQYSPLRTHVGSRRGLSRRGLRRRGLHGLSRRRGLLLDAGR